MCVVLFPALLGPCQVLLFGPLTIYSTNRTEFLAPFWSLAPRWVWVLVPVVGTLTAIGLVLPARWFTRYVAVLFAIGVLLWTQGNLLIADYGLLDGGGLDLAIPPWWVPFESVMWVGTVALAAGFAAAIAKAATVGSQVLMVMQSIILLPTLATTAPLTTSDASTRWRVPPPEIYQLSRTQNIIHIVLDMFPTELFTAIVESDRDTFDRDLSGFTIFADHLGAFPTTKASMPAMLTGVAYRNEMPFDAFLESRARPSIFEALGHYGFELRSLSSFRLDHPRGAWINTTIRYTIPTPYSTSRDYRDFAAAQLLDLSLFRHALHGVKAGIYRDQRWLFQQWLAAQRSVVAERPFSDTAFLLEFARRATLGGDDPTYTFLHLITPHYPIVVDRDCTYLGARQRLTRKSYTAQAECALAGVVALLDRLRELDIYDNSAILVTSDHGLGVLRPDNHPLQGIHSPAGDLDQIALAATPLLAIKPAGSRSPMQTSYVPSAITDIPATILDLAGLPNVLGRGESVFSLDPAMSRTRTYAHHPNTVNWSRPYFDVPLNVFTVNGQVTSPDAWRYEQVIAPISE